MDSKTFSDLIKTAIESENDKVVLDFSSVKDCVNSIFPLKEISSLGSRLYKINCAGQRFSSLPIECNSREQLSALSNLHTLFFLGNAFEEIPEELGALPSLFMLSFKSNKLRSIHEGSLSPSIGWLILTDNHIPRLPRSIGALSHLRKLMLSGNQLESLPDELSLCSNLELVRLSDNRLTSLPASFLSLPRLAWLALASNPLTATATEITLTQRIKNSSESAGSCLLMNKLDLKLGTLLGEGASGSVYNASFATSLIGNSSSARKGDNTVAVKVFKPTSSDGKPEDEVNVARCLPPHRNLIESIGYYDEVSGGDDLQTPVRSLGLVMEKIDGHLLGSTPSFSSITRDTFPDGIKFSLAECLRIAKGVSAALIHMHKFGIAHGDVYAHNILIGGPSGVKLGDFGAAYVMPKELKDRLTRIDWRGFGFLLDDLLTRCDEGLGSDSRKELEGVRTGCLRGDGEDAVKMLKGVLNK
jgi:hypothetical protein